MYTPIHWAHDTQVYNAVELYKVPMDEYPKIMKVYEEAKSLPAFQKAWPDVQPDFK